MACLSAGEPSREWSSVSRVVFFERKFASIISWVCLCFVDELEESLDFLLFLEGSLGDYAKPISYFAVLVASTCWTSK